MQARKLISHTLWALLSLFITMVIVLGAVYAYMEFQLPDVEMLKDMHMQVPLQVYTRDGVLIASYGAKRRIPVTLDQVPKDLVNAVLAVEDARYYSHPGVDFVGLVRAAKAVISSGRKVQGASTITMQVARNFFLSSEKTYGRKLQEILLALKIDKELSKEKVLELYLNKVYFGMRAYGVAAAAQAYYGKKLDQLTLAEMAMLAGLPQAPSRNNPLHNPRAAIVRRNHVLDRMHEVGFIDAKTYEKAIRAPLTASYYGPRVQLRAPYVSEMVRRVMVAEYGEQAYESGIKVYTTIDAKLQREASDALQNGLISYARRHGYRRTGENFGWPTKDKLNDWLKRLQQLSAVHRLQPAVVLDTRFREADALMANGAVITIPWEGMAWARPALKDGFIGGSPYQTSSIMKPGDLIWIDKTPQGNWELNQIPQVQGAIISVSPEDGALLALSGGFDYALSNFNRAVQAERQPGSNFKPFIYSAALAQGITLSTIVNDAPIVIRDYGENNFWRPQNDKNRFHGPTRVRVGLMQSINLVAVRVLQEIGIPYTLKYVSAFGFDSNKLPHSLSMALGSGLVTPLQVAMGFTVFANGGYKVQPYFVEKIVDQEGKVVFKANPAKACTQCITNPKLPLGEMPQPPAVRVITAQNAYLITSALQSVINEGTGRAATVLKRTDLAGKTGTTNEKVDAWFTGFNSKLLTTVWVGFDNLEPLHEYGSQSALPIWIDYMGKALQGMPESTMPQPPDIVTVRIDPYSGLPASPRQRNAIFEIFSKQFMPGNRAMRSDSEFSGSRPGSTATQNVEDSGGLPPPGSTSGTSGDSGGDDNGSEEQLF